MYCDYLVLLFLGFAAKDSEHESGEDVGNKISNVLKEVSKYCKGETYHGPPYLPPPPPTPPTEPSYDFDNHFVYQEPESIYKDLIHPMEYYPYRVDDYLEEHRVPHHGVPFQYDSANVTPSRRMQILQQQYGELPIVSGTNELVKVVNNNQVAMVRIPEPVVMNLVTPDQLSVLYQKNQAFDVPSTDPSMPRLIAMTTRVLSSILKAKKRFHNVIDHGVAGAENLFGGIHEAAGGIAELIGGGAHGLLDLVV
ncbi:PREDICTED: uncharacterized protein LOC106105345 [Papilio polytes]|uniref:uncharacterized protein LOC106105345 n=1 Tax=Papilio polytes TaxID=76194 RepID=UPI000676A061|nr:PREDICTED: uncharacterized protein LOC106105345 [Papilio polytes]